LETTQHNNPKCVTQRLGYNCEAFQNGVEEWKKTGGLIFNFILDCYLVSFAIKYVQYFLTYRGGLM